MHRGDGRQQETQCGGDVTFYLVLHLIFLLAADAPYTWSCARFGFTTVCVMVRDMMGTQRAPPRCGK